MSTRAELVAELHALASYVTLLRPLMIDPTAPPTDKCWRRMDTIAWLLVDGPPPVIDEEWVEIDLPEWVPNHDRCGSTTGIYRCLNQVGHSGPHARGRKR